MASQLKTNDDTQKIIIDQAIANFDTKSQIIDENMTKSYKDLATHEAILERIESD